MVNKKYNIYKEKKSGEGSNDHMTVGKGEGGGEGVFKWSRDFWERGEREREEGWRGEGWALGPLGLPVLRSSNTRPVG